MRGSRALHGCLPLKLLFVQFGNVVNPSIGTSFDSFEEVYEFYNLYSWEVSFGVHYAKSRLNVHRKKCMQEIVCACAVSQQHNINSPLHLEDFELSFHFLSLCHATKMCVLIYNFFMFLITCACLLQGNPLQANSRSTRCGCNAMIQLLRSDDGGWYVCEHSADHNHDLSVNCGEKLH